MEYIYVTDNNLEARQYYHYSKYNGEDFLKAYQDNRASFLNIPQVDESKILELCNNTIKTHYQNLINDETIILNFSLCNIVLELFDNNNGFNSHELLGRILKTFEVRKRLYHCYNKNFKPFDDSDYNDLQLYILFGIAMSKAYEKSNNLKYLNGLMKVCDILLSITKTHSQNIDTVNFVSYIINCEQTHFINLKKKLLEV